MHTQLARWLLLLGVALLVPMSVSRLWLGRLDRVSGLLAVAGVACLIAAAVELAMRRRSAATRVNVRLMLAAVAMVWLGAEAVLRFGGSQLGTYPELNGGFYRNPFASQMGRFHVYLPGQSVEAAKYEFTHRRVASSIGLTDGELPAAKRSGEYRIVALGDSFTEGVGTPADGTWVRVMQRALAARYPRIAVTTYNAGVSGSDPINEFVLLKEKLLPLRPDLVIVATNASDVNDTVMRGGRERFLPDGRVRYREGPAWEPVYAASYVARMVAHNVLGYNRVLIRHANMAEESASAVATLAATFDDFERLCRAEGIGLLVAMHPVLNEAASGAYDPSFAQLARALRERPNINVVDVLGEFSRDGTITTQNAAEFYWKRDLHHNPRGYDALGNVIARRVIALGLVETDAVDK